MLFNIEWTAIGGLLSLVLLVIVSVVAYDKLLGPPLAARSNSRYRALVVRFLLRRKRRPDRSRRMEVTQRA